MSSSFEARCRSLLVSLGLCGSDDVSEVRRLSGGVASDIAAVSFDGRTVCAKFALEKLQVDEDWFAPVHRGKAEFAWLKAAGAIVPRAAPDLYGWSDAENGFAMEYLAGPDVSLWKANLLAGQPDQGEAVAVANVIGRIHARSAASDFDRTAFDNADDFDSLRIDPYLRFTAQQHPELAIKLFALAEQLSASRLALVHGDVSPKNVIIRDGQPLLLDAECASMGDPAFDVAFCLNHLILKSLHLPGTRADLLRSAQQWWTAYATHVNWEVAERMEARVAALLPALMLARVDGKSPVEYLSERNRDRIRALSHPLIQTPIKHLRPLLETIHQESDT